MPSAPRNFELVAVNGSRDILIATWTPPDPTNGIIFSYRIYCVQHLAYHTVPGIDTVAVLYVAPDSELNCSVVAMTGAGLGNYSQSMVARTGQYCEFGIIIVSACYENMICGCMSM